MKIESAKYADNYGPELQLTIDGERYSVSWEQKPTLVRHGITYAELPTTAVLPNGEEVQGATDDKGVFLLTTNFGLDAFYGRFEVGKTPSLKVDLDEWFELGERLQPFALQGAAPWTSIVFSAAAKPIKLI